MATFWKIAARPVNNLFSLYFVYLLYLFISRFGLKRGLCLLIAPGPVRCFSITFLSHKIAKYFENLRSMIFKRSIGHREFNVNTVCINYYSWLILTYMFITARSFLVQIAYCAYARLRCQVGVYRTIGSLV